MSGSSLDVFGVAERKLAWADQRQAVLAQNIANANTPGYSAKDVTSFRDMLLQQVSGASEASGASATLARGTVSTGRSLDGNAVVLDQQLEKVAETDNAHQLAMNLFRKYAGMWRTALGRS